MDDMDVMLEALGLDEFSLSSQLMGLSSIITLIVAAVFGFLILLVYLKTSGREARDRNLFMVIPVLTLLMAVIMRIEGAQVVLFFGIFGILSIVRFRSDLTDQKGITFILFSVIQGVLVGANQYILGILAFLVVSSAIFVAKFAFPSRMHYRIIVKTDSDPLRMREILESWLKKSHLPYRYVNFNSERSQSSKIQSWIVRTRLEYEISLHSEGDLQSKWKILLEEIKEEGIEAEIKPGSAD